MKWFNHHAGLDVAIYGKRKLPIDEKSGED